MSAPDAGAPPQPDPVREEPPADRFCDLVLNGGVASGVVYPWALVELARHYRFRSVGGNSVGAIAAAVAAAAEYGRCIGVENAFEPLRQLPLKLAKVEGGKTKMLRLFQPSAPLRRLFDLCLDAINRVNPEDDKSVLEQAALKNAAPPGAPTKESPRAISQTRLTLRVLWKYRVSVPLVVLLSIAALAASQVHGGGIVPDFILAILAISGAVLIALANGVAWLYRDLRALADNDYGICTGRGQEPGEEGLVEWMHRGIQLSAGRGKHDPPLTFADLWAAPRFGEPGPSPLPGGLEPPHPGVNLQMFASNVTLARPVRLPLNDPNTRLYYQPKEWARYFPDYVMEALQKASRPYTPASGSDPDPATTKDPKARALMESLRELPSGGMPIVVAARLSLCFPVLFSSVRVYAVDYEAKRQERRLRRCLLSDGGLCTNFPIHLFDAAHPRWPTFGFLLDTRLQAFPDELVWRPITHREGRADNWLRFVPGVDDSDEPKRPVLKRLLGGAVGLGVAMKDRLRSAPGARFKVRKPGLLGQSVGFVGGLVVTMKDWNDRVTGRLPQVRNRVIRLALKNGEGQLNLGMPPETILRMAHDYGTVAGKKLAEDFVPGRDGAKPAWREHVYVRSIIELRALRRHVRGYAQAVQSAGNTVPLREVFDAAIGKQPLRLHWNRPDPTTERLTPAQRQALDRAVQAVKALEDELSACEAQFGPYVPVVAPEFHLRPPM